MNKQLIPQSSSPPVFRPSIEGFLSLKLFIVVMLPFVFHRDPAARRFGWYLLITLGAMTIGVVVGIVAGNIAHYRTFCFKQSFSLSVYIYFL